MVEKEEGSKEYYIYTYCGKVLDVCEGKKSNGTLIIQWEFNGEENQLWNFCDPNNITSESSEIDWSLQIKHIFIFFQPHILTYQFIISICLSKK